MNKPKTFREYQWYADEEGMSIPDLADWIKLHQESAFQWLKDELIRNGLTKDEKLEFKGHYLFGNDEAINDGIVLNFVGGDSDTSLLFIRNRKGGQIDFDTAKQHATEFEWSN